MAKWMREFANVEVRKVTRIGNSRGITLPGEWIKSNHYKISLEEGDRIVLEPVK